LQGIDLDVVGGCGYEWGVFVLQALSVAGEQDYVVYVFGGEFCGDVLGGWVSDVE
jgi:hypothetical protein